jgi:hypothetical protein
VINSTQVLFTNSSVTTILLITLQSNSTLPRNAKILTATLDFKIAYLASAAKLSLVLQDEFGDQAGNVSFVISAVGPATVSLKDLLASLLAQYQQTFVIRAIRGSILKVSLQIDTADVPVNVESEVTSTLSYETPSSPPQTTTVGTVPEQPSSLQTGALIGIIIGSIVGGILVLAVFAAILLTVLYFVVKHRKHVRIQEQYKVHPL